MLIGSVSVRRFQWVPTTYVFTEFSRRNNKKAVQISFLSGLWSWGLVLDKSTSSTKKWQYFPPFSMTGLYYCAHWNHLIEMILQSTNDVYFCREIWKIANWILRLSSVKSWKKSLFQKNLTCKFYDKIMTLWLVQIVLNYVFSHYEWSPNRENAVKYYALNFQWGKRYLICWNRGTLAQALTSQSIRNECWKLKSLPSY